MGDRKTQDFSKGKIYVIRNNVNDLVYVGSTCQTLSRRMSCHRTDAKKQNSKIYEAMRDIGIKHFYIELHEDFPCERREQLFAREGFHIRAFADKVYNKCVMGRTKKEFHAAYYEGNADKFKESAVAYRAANVTKIKEYRAANATKIKLSKAAYCAANADKIKQYKAAYRAAKKAEKAQTILVLA